MSAIAEVLEKLNCASKSINEAIKALEADNEKCTDTPAAEPAAPETTTTEATPPAA